MVIKINKNLLITAIVLLILAILSISGYFYFSYQGRNNIEEELVQVDDYILEGDYTKAERILTQISSKTPDRYSCYRVIKRGIEISEITNNYEIFYTVSQRAAELYSGNEDLHAYYVMSLLKTKRYKEAYQIAMDQLISDEFKPLLTQAILYNDSGNENIIAYIESKKDPSFFEYLATLLNDGDLYIDSALLWAKSGEIEKAYSIINNQKNSKIKELNALLSYDSGRNSEALTKFLDLSESDAIKFDNIMIIGDLFYIKENFPRAKYYYEEALKLGVISATPFINISSIYLRTNNTKQAISYLEQANSYLKNKLQNSLNEIDEALEDSNGDLSLEERSLVNELISVKQTEVNNINKEYKKVVLLLYHMYKDTSSDKYIKLLEDYRRDFPNDAQVKLLYLKDNSSKINPDMFIADLWKLLNNDVDNQEISEFMVWYLLGISNYDDINLILERNDNRSPNNSWTKYYKGILYAMNKDYTSAKKALQSLPNSDENWEIIYNRAVVEVALGNYPEALTLYNKALILISQELFLQKKDSYISKVKTKIAQVLIILDDKEEAIRMLNSASELDPDNYSSELLKSLTTDLKDN